MRILFIIGIFLSTAFSSKEHDIHVSRCDIELYPDKGMIELSMRIFYDDLLSAVGLTIGEELPNDYSSADELIAKFINENFIVEVNGEIKTLKYVESNSYPPAVWTSLEVEQKGKINEIKIKNTILLDLFDDQTNIVSLDWKGKKKTIAMDQKNHLISFK